MGNNWAPGEPDNRLGEENCVAMLRNNGQWGDKSCSYVQAKTLCEKLITQNDGQGKYNSTAHSFNLLYLTRNRAWLFHRKNHESEHRI